MSEKTSSAGAPVGAEAPPDVPARWSAARKTDVVLRLLRGAPVDVVARETHPVLHRAGGVVLVVRCDRPRQRRHRGLARREDRRPLGRPRARAPGHAADAFRNELTWLGITHTPSFVGEPQCNGVIERFIRTLKEQCLWLHRFETLAEARPIIAAFIRRYNEEWIIERLDYRTPAIARQELAAVA